MTSTLIDANVLLRYILDDNEEMALQAELLIQGGAWTTPEVLAEVTYVLESVYQVERSEIAGVLEMIANSVELESQLICMEAIRIYRNSKLDYVDCMIAAYAIKGNEHFFSFDKALNRYVADNML